MEALNKIVESCPEIIKLDTSNKNLLSRAEVSSFSSEDVTKSKKNIIQNNNQGICYDNSSNENLNQNFIIVTEKQISKVCCTADRVIDNCSIF
jgi:hypothetical protein